LIKVAINGGRRGAPSTPHEMADDVASCVAAGATVFHVHPRDRFGAESLLPADADAAVAAIRARSPNISLGLTTGAWILPDPRQRVEAVRAWSERPDFASVNFDEDGCVEVAHALIAAGIGVEAGLLDRTTTELFLASQVPVVRVLIEIQEQNVADATRQIDAIVGALGDHPAPRLLHGHGAIVWEMVDEAFRRGYDTRIGLEDVETDLTNEELWQMARGRSR
jgi:uncharacterized protein (DUF849 family)